MVIIKEEFKAFVKERPELINYVTKGEMTWQKFYEIWSLYGNDEKIWDKYKEENITSKDYINNQSFSLSSLADWVRKVDMNQVQKSVNAVQKVIGLLQGLTESKTNDNTSSYEPRQVFKKFED